VLFSKDVDMYIVYDSWHITYVVCRRFVMTGQMLTVWRPTKETIGLLQEGRRYHIFHLTARSVR